MKLLSSCTLQLFGCYLFYFGGLGGDNHLVFVFGILGLMLCYLLLQLSLHVLEKGKIPEKDREEENMVRNYCMSVYSCFVSRQVQQTPSGLTTSN